DEIENGLEGYVIADKKGHYLNILFMDLCKKIPEKNINTHGPYNYSNIGSANIDEMDFTGILGASLTLIAKHRVDTMIDWSNAYDESEEGKIDVLVGRFSNEIWKNGGRMDGSCPIATCIKTGIPQEAEVITLDGYTMLQRAFPLKNQDGNISGAISSTLDMSSVSPTNEAMRAAARIQASATLAGGIAHKFNNLMSAILGNVSLATVDIPAENPMLQLLKEIEHAAVTAGDLSEQLLVFARGGKYMQVPINLNDVIMQTIQTQALELPDNIRLLTSFDNKINLVEANHAQITLLLSQLISNAIEAYDVQGSKRKDGIIQVSTVNRFVDSESESAGTWLKNGRYVLLTVSDTGCGMSPETKKKIFEPFFTTKKKGRGLGLASAYGIVRSHEGHIFIESEKERGTTVRVYIPVSNVSEMPDSVLQIVKDKRDNSDFKEEIKGGTETILVVDDEAMLRKAIKRLLQRLGYNVLEAHTGVAAINVATEHKGKIDLTLLDMIMPGIEGLEAYRQLHKLHPEMPVIIMSGYDSETYGKPLLSSGASSFLQKPVPMDTFAREIRRVLDEKND
ncbi:MAG: response regulator, partial [Deltaproteobacteria bacterium]|nr:response regulator [Deltaproteobacteria bacterium]